MNSAGVTTRSEAKTFLEVAQTIAWMLDGRPATSDGLPPNSQGGASRAGSFMESAKGKPPPKRRSGSDGRTADRLRRRKYG